MSTASGLLDTNCFALSFRCGYLLKSSAVEFTRSVRLLCVNSGILAEIKSDHLIRSLNSGH